MSSSAQKMVRPSAAYQPGLRTNEFLTSPKMVNDKDNIYVFELKEEIKRMLTADVTKTSKKLNLIDEIQRLGIAYHFEAEINIILENIHKGLYKFDLDDDYDNLNFTSLHFRLLRQHGYRVSSEVFNKFKNVDGNFKESLTIDIKGLLSLYEASHLRVHGESILDQALVFTIKNLESISTEIVNKTSLAKQIQHALNGPLRKGVPRIEARFFIEEYQEDPLHNELILTFAKMDFNILQNMHQKEFSDIARWWKSYNFPKKLPFARHRLVENYFWSVGFYFEPEYVLARRIATQMFIMATMINDIYDVYGTTEELEIFTDVIQRGYVSDKDLLPESMQCCYEALLDIYEEIERDIAFGDNAYYLHYAEELIKELVTNYHIKSKWRLRQYVPTMEEYMPNGIHTGGLIWVTVAAILGMGEIVTKEAFEWAFSKPKITMASATISRLMNDAAGYKLELKRTYDPSAVECYMKQHGVSEEEANKFIFKEIENAWKDINEEYLKPLIVPMPLLDRVLNFARTIDCFYKKNDSFTFSCLLKDNIVSLLKDPIPL